MGQVKIQRAIKSQVPKKKKKNQYVDFELYGVAIEAYELRKAVWV